MNEPKPVPPPAGAFDADFRKGRIEALTSANLNAYWALAIVIVAFGGWDYYADPSNWRRAFVVRLIGAVLVAATGLYQNLPGRQRALVAMSKVRLVIAVVSMIAAASLLSGGYAFGVAGLAVIVLAGPFVAIDSRDLVKTNVAVLATALLTMMLLQVEAFERTGTAVVLVLAAGVSMLLGRALEASNRRAFMLALEQQRDARTDALTGLDNRRAMQERGRGEVKLASRTGAPVSVILCDFDHFKIINETHGRDAGDAALVKASRLLRSVLRESDALGRWGGEEFIALLPATNSGGAHHVGERMRAVVEGAFGELAGGATISVGVATSEQIDDPALEWDLLIKEADQRLYRAKHDGRNRVVSIDRPK